MKVFCMRCSNNMWKDFKHALKKSYESCPPEEWETMRDKRLTNDDWNIFIKYWALEETLLSNIYCRGPC